ncbi:adenylate/guanylate cyclase domain-containing protein [Flammeovirgaceae bacterium SG7u.111]|nr:adenylate/guanylate cyclase domain-containing protein [Flammeovirgaceae bacterium SG7u.132]WPO38001.1 adenylate/guanylate cyclase domain-containing protein [Flammeovirgaceae bacterium SG7u.111]
MLSPKAKWNLSRILPFGVIWLASALIFLVVEKGAVGMVGANPEWQIEMTLSVFVFSSLAAFSVGLIFGSIEIFYLNRVFSSKSFLKKILYKLLIYVVVMYVVVFITYPIAASLDLGTSLFDKQVLEKFYSYLTSINHLSTDVQLAVTQGLCLLYTEISENIGNRVFFNLFRGKYHQPKEEERVFMFLDMKSSTTIAERLGHITYFELLKTYYADISDAVINNGGEVYQYVGDEMVVSWRVKRQVNYNHCINCFFAMKEALAGQKVKYEERFGVLPSFKAGLHLGKVTTGEIGVVKREIIFTGDVLNTTARIQSLCNEFEVDLLVSGELVSRLDLKDIRVNELGEKVLKGKKEPVVLYSLG